MAALTGLPNMDTASGLRSDNSTTKELFHLQRVGLEAFNVCTYILAQQ